jgi:general stress protein YciG
MPHERVTLSAKVREYFAEIGRRGGASSRRELTPRQAKLMVTIREAKRTAREEGKPPPKLTRQHRAILRQRR